MRFLAILCVVSLLVGCAGQPSTTTTTTPVARAAPAHVLLVGSIQPSFANQIPDGLVVTILNDGGTSVGLRSASLGIVHEPVPVRVPDTKWGPGETKAVAVVDDQVMTDPPSTIPIALRLKFDDGETLNVSHLLRSNWSVLGDPVIDWDQNGIRAVQVILKNEGVFPARLDAGLIRIEEGEAIMRAEDTALIPPGAQSKQSFELGKQIEEPYSIAPIPVTIILRGGDADVAFANSSILSPRVILEVVSVDVRGCQTWVTRCDVYGATLRVSDDSDTPARLWKATARIGKEERTVWLSEPGGLRVPAHGSVETTLDLFGMTMPRSATQGVFSILTRQGDEAAKASTVVQPT